MIYVNGRFMEQDMTGVQRFAYEIITNLIKLRNDIIVLVPDIDKVRVKNKNCTFNLLEVKGGNGHFWEQITLPSFLIKHGKPLLINLCSTAPVFYANKISTHHDITYIKYPESYSAKFRYLYKIIIPLMLKGTRKLITVSEFSKNEIASHYKYSRDKIVVIYNSINENFTVREINVKSASEKKYALAVSSPNYHKNFRGMISAFVSSGIDMDLKIIGGLSKSFNTVDYQCVNDSRIKFLGRVDDEELIKVYNGAEFFIFPSFYEGFGIPPIEAQACGCPVISSSAACMKEVLGESVLYFDPFSVNDINDKIKIIADKSELRNELRRKGIENVKRYSWAASAKKLNEIINSLI